MARAKKKKTKSREQKIAEEVRNLCKKYPNEVLNQLLATPFWPKELEIGEQYERYDDDTRYGRIAVRCGNDSDVWIAAPPDPKEPNLFHRFRFYPRGESERTHMALKFLAVAIALDNVVWPQDRSE